MKSIFICISLIMFTTLPVMAENELTIGKFSSADLSGWKEQTYFNSKKTTYSFVQDNGKTVLMGRSNNSASGMIYKIKLDPQKYPIIKWSWKIEHTLKNANDRTKEGNDFAARLYVVFPRGFFSSTRAIEYVWGNAMHSGESARSPYSKNFIMIAVDSGDGLTGRWVFHKRNIAEDYRNSFGEEVPKIGAIAIMTDSDNTHESSIGYYGDITLMPASKEEEQKSKEPSQKEQPGFNGSSATTPAVP